MSTPTRDVPAWHELAPQAAIETVSSNAESGLTAAEVSRRLEEHGPNALKESKRRSILHVFLAQFQSPLIYLLFVAAGIALALGHTSDGIVIFAVVILNSLIGAIQEGRAERSLASLRKLATHKARLVRDGEEVVVAARDVVPGDIILLEAGDAVSADARLLEAFSLHVAEASLTGESVPVAKAVPSVAADTALADRHDMVYAGTHVTSGHGRAVVIATGLGTEIGHIAALAESAQEPKTPLERRIAQFGRYLIYAAGVTFVLVVAIGLWDRVPIGDILMVGISQLVGMIPEGLPVAMTIALAVGVQRMAKRKAVVRRLAAVEALGSTTVICSDKTGTLTKNEMTVTEIVFPRPAGAGSKRLTVEGIGYLPEGRFLDGESELALGGRNDGGLQAELKTLLEAIVLCNDSQLTRQQQAGGPGRWNPIGDPTEVALLVAAMKAGLAPGELRRARPRKGEIPFDSTTKMMATAHECNGESFVVVKGAPEAVFELCARPADAEREMAEHMAAHALRVLAVGKINGATISGEMEFSAFAGKVELLGLVGQIDPPRAEVKEAVDRCRLAGIKPVMVTGDHKATGYAIAKALGIAQGDDRAIDGRELEQMSDQALASQLDGISVFARVHPAQKLRIVDAYQRRHEIVAMTGDGVNDAPALVKANVGVAMGITGTEVAKEAAKIVISDDNFATIIAAVEEGRVVYRNIKKAVLLLFSTSAAEVVVLLVAMLLGYPPPFAAVQILWNNLVTEGVITVNLVMEPAEGDEMSQKPIPPNEPLLTRNLLSRLVLMVITISAVSLGWFIFRSHQGASAATVQTETFTLLAICEWFNVLNCRSATKSALALGLLRNRWLLGGLIVGNVLQFAVVFWPLLNRTFRTVPIGFTEVVMLGVVGSLVLWAEEVRKWWARRPARSSS